MYVHVELVWQPESPEPWEGFTNLDLFDNPSRISRCRRACLIFFQKPFIFIAQGVLDCGVVNIDFDIYAGFVWQLESIEPATRRLEEQREDQLLA